MSNETDKLAEMLMGHIPQEQKQKDAFQIGFMHITVLFLLKEHIKEHGDKVFTQIKEAFKARYLLALAIELKEREKVAGTPMGKLFSSMIGENGDQILIDAEKTMNTIIEEVKVFLSGKDEDLEKLAELNKTFDKTFKK